MFTSLVRKTQEFFGPSNAPRVPLLGAASSTATNVGYSSAGVVTYPQTSEPMTAMSGVVSSSVTPTINNSTKLFLWSSTHEIILSKTVDGCCCISTNFEQY